jgi:hypothetical protein
VWRVKTHWVPPESLRGVKGENLPGPRVENMPLAKAKMKLRNVKTFQIPGSFKKQVLQNTQYLSANDAEFITGRVTLVASTHLRM